MSFSLNENDNVILSHHKDATEESIWLSEKSSSREFRASNMPYCSILNVLSYFENKSYPAVERYRESFYFRIGHAVHYSWQKAMHLSKYGDRVYGNWLCIKCNKTIGPQLNPKNPPSCGGDCPLSWEYQEIDLLYRGLTGHPDLITWYGDHYWTLWEFKTVPHWFLQSGKGVSHYQMFPKHKLQALIYATILYKMYKLKVKNIALVYAGRENPKDSKVLVLDFDEKVYKETLILLKDSVKRRKQATKFIHKKSSVQSLIQSRPCYSKTDYINKMKMKWFGKQNCPLYNMKICAKKDTTDLAIFLKEATRIKNNEN